MPSYRDLLRDAKARITEITPEEAEGRLGRATFLDVREQDEHDQGTIPGSVFIPRGHLESNAETRLVDREEELLDHVPNNLGIGPVISDRIRIMRGKDDRWRRCRPGRLRQARVKGAKENNGYVSDRQGRFQWQASL